MTPEVKVADDEWRPLRRMVGERLLNTGQEYAEVCFVPNWAGHSKNNPDNVSDAECRQCRVGPLSKPVVRQG